MLSPDQQARLEMLQAARDKLIMGQAIASVEYAGERREYTKADLTRLDRAIDELQHRYGSVRLRL